ncbi:hypothetical protein GCM10025861_17520 [Methanobacterium petrolearium]|nr:hypothetical protein GCM10025861_17520 [Methanobacterium petrolearium]
MLVNEMMDKDFIVVSPDDDLIDVSILMEKKLRFTTPVVDEKRSLLDGSLPWMLPVGLGKVKKG